MISNKRGGALVTVLIVTGVFCILIYVMPNFLRQRQSSTEDEIRVLQAKMLAQDVVELGKYFLSFERVIYLNNPLALTATRRSAQLDLARQSYGSLVAQNSFLVNACGGYDSLANEVGDLKVQGEKVFCPYFVRNPLMSGQMFQNMMLKLWSSSASVQLLRMNAGALETIGGSRNAIMTRLDSKAYSLQINLNETFKDTDNQFLRLHVDQTLVKNMRSINPDITLTYTFFTPESGFEGQSSERYITVRADVTYGNIFRRQITNSESIIMYISTVKDFSIFNVFPEDSSGVQTKSFASAMNLGGPNSEVHGRVFFNGNIDTDLADLPVFNEVVIISGELISARPYAKVRELMAQKFKKGLIVRFPAERMIHDGNCVPGLAVANQTQMFCHDPNDSTENFGMSNYIGNLNNICSGLKVTASAGAYSYNTAGNSNPMVQEYCKGSAPSRLFISGGVAEMTASGSHVYVMSPVKNLKLAAGINVYGTILGGHIEAAGAVKFYNFNSVKKGLAGIADDAQLAALSTEASLIQTGIGVPLVNVPLIKKAYLGD